MAPFIQFPAQPIPEGTLEKGKRTATNNFLEFLVYF